MIKHSRQSLSLAAATAFATTFIVSILPLIAAEVPAVFHAEGFLTRDAEPHKVEILEATPQSVVYREAGSDPASPAESVTVELKGGTTVFICEPPAYAKAIDLYQGRKYTEALAKFVEVKTSFMPLQSLEDSYSSLAAYHEMECLRKIGKLEDLAPALQKFPKGALTRETQRRQLELSVFWEAVRTKDWNRIDKLAREHANVRLPEGQRAQVAYCHGLALEGLGKPTDALLEYNTAITSDAGASEEVARPAALRILTIYDSDPEVAAALKLPSRSGSPSIGENKLAQAIAVARLFEQSLGGGAPLPPELRKFHRTKEKLDQK